MDKSKETTYRSSQFTLADLREIVEDHEFEDEDSKIDLSVDPGDPPYAGTSYSITVRKSPSRYSY